MYFPSYRTKKNGVPILKKAEIEIIAERFIADFSPEALETPMEIDVDSFVLNYLGMKQDFQYLSHNGVYLGMTVFNDTNKVPVYKPETNTAEYAKAKARTVIIDNNLLEEDQEHRYRYTMGHEGGHDILHKGYFSYNPNQISLFEPREEPIIQCRAVPINGNLKPVELWDDKDSMEWQANYLSSALLMPKKMVFKLINSLPKRNDMFKDATYVHEVVNTFNVSWQAAENRLNNLGIIKDTSSTSSLRAVFLDFGLVN
jgi:Zn-dependent peptidase ImmA (M78 family)